MEKEGIILVAEHNEEHFSLIHRNLLHAGIKNEVVRFTEAKQLLDFLAMTGDGPKRQADKKYLLVLNANMPEMDGVEILASIKQDSELKKIPVIMLADKEDRRQAELCHNLGCSVYITKPVDPDDFREVVERLGFSF